MILCDNQRPLKAPQRLERSEPTDTYFTKETNRMPIIAPISRITLEIADPDEFCPIELLELAIDKFSVKCHEFARIFGTEPQTVSAWRCGRRTPTKQCRIRAHYLGKQWGLI